MIIIVLISEARFTNRSYLRIPNYDIYDTEHPDGIDEPWADQIINYLLVIPPQTQNWQPFILLILFLTWKSIYNVWQQAKYQ